MTMETKIYTRDQFDEMSAYAGSVEFYYLLHPERDMWSAGNLICLNPSEVNITADFEAHIETMDKDRYNETVLRDSLFKYTADFAPYENILVIVFKEKPVIKEPSIGDEIVAIRVFNNMTRRELSRASRVNYNYLTKIENGQLKEPGITNINKLLAVFGLKLGIVEQGYKHDFS